MDELIGQSLESYQLLERIGQGGMATVYRAYQPSLKREVALKVIQLSHHPDDETFRKRFAQEAELVAALDHLHILPIYEYGIVGDKAYLAMRLLRGGTLADVLRKGPMPLEDVVRIFGQVARGLEHSHSKGVIHRDLKPSNIMMDESHNAYLADFGLAKISDSTNPITHTDNIVGTPAYMSPEQLRGEKLDARSDIYSLGVILYQMVTGHPPFESKTSDLVSVIYKHLEETPKPPSEFNATLPPQVESVILTALQKFADDRYESSLDMAKDLEAAFSGSQTLTMRRTPIARRPVRRVSWFGAPWLMIGMALGLMVVVGGFFMLMIVQEQSNSQSTQTAAVWTPTPIATAIVRPDQRSFAQINIPTQEQVEIARTQIRGRFVAYIPCTLDTAYHASQAREIAELLRGYGIDMRIYNSNNDLYIQATQLEIARTEGAAALIICPLDVTVLAESLEAAQRSSIPIVYLASTLPNTYGGVVLASDEYEMGLRAGRFAGRYIRDELNGQANVLVLDYDEIEQLVIRAEGLVDGVLEFAPNATILGRFRGGTPDLGQASVAQVLASGATFDVIVSINDAGAYGAIEALEAADIPASDVFISSIDAEAVALEYIRRDYYFRGSLRVDRLAFSEAAANAIVKLLAGGEMDETWIVPPGIVVTRQILAEEENLLSNATAEATEPSE
jgi:serine/threonine protein kinase/ABC-type sugar transport system substrate-binding protein